MTKAIPKKSDGQCPGPTIPYRCANWSFQTQGVCKLDLAAANAIDVAVRCKKLHYNAVNAGQSEGVQRLAERARVVRAELPRFLPQKVAVHFSLGTGRMGTARHGRERNGTEGQGRAGQGK